jgi:indolepyruvate ferredoxin oxidoreductase beta subunit
LAPPGEIDFLVVLADGEADAHRGQLRPGGVLIPHDAVDPASLADRRSLNVALLGVLSRHLPIDTAAWHDAIRKNLKAHLHEANLRAFEIGRAAAHVC